LAVHTLRCTKMPWSWLWRWKVEKKSLEGSKSVISELGYVDTIWEKVLAGQVSVS
jgi:hypothetical protein